MNLWTKEEVEHFKKIYSTKLDKVISVEIGRSIKSVSYMACKLSLKKDLQFYCLARKRTEINVTRQQLENLYIDQQKSIRKMALELGVAKNTIEYYLKKYQIPRRTPSSAGIIRFSKEKNWNSGLTKENDIRLKENAEKIRKAHLSRQKDRLEKIEKGYGFSLPAHLISQRQVTFSLW